MLEKFNRFKRNRMLAQNQQTLMLCATEGCETILEKKRKKKNRVTCAVCSQDTCVYCQTQHDASQECAQFREKQMEEWLGTGINNIHRCPKCNVVFEKITGCSEMSCSNCNYVWCWVCGMKYESKTHQFFMIPCQLINVTFLNSAVPGWARFLLFFFFWALVPSLFLLAFTFCCIVFGFADAYRSRKTQGRFWSSIYCYNHGKPSKQVIGDFLLIAVPFWFLYGSMAVAVSILMFVLLLIPLYIMSFIVMIRLIWWWNKNKRVK